MLREQLTAARQENETLKTRDRESAYIPMTNRYPKLEPLSPSHTVRQVEIRCGDESIVLTDPAVLQSFLGLMTVTDERQLGSGPQADIEPVQYAISTDAGTIIAHIEELGVASFPELYPGKLFQIDKNAYQLAKAFIKKPAYLGEEPLEAKMAQSGVLKVQADSAFSLIRAGRIRSIALAFVQADKREIAAPQHTVPAALQLTFYYYGETIRMNVYDGLVQVSDRSRMTWYAMNKEDSQQLQAQVSAG